MACHITGVYDVNRSMTLEDDNYELVRAWAESLVHFKVKGIIFHNNFSKETCDNFSNEFISFIKIKHNPQFNPNVFRYFIYKEFLQEHSNEFENVFITDVTDVVMLKNPFKDKFFLENKLAVFCGDESKILENDWMKEHATHLRNNISNYADYEMTFAKETLLNCGIIGGSIVVLQDFINKLWSIHQEANSDNKTAFTGDMGAFNYLARTQFNEQLKYGGPVNTVFKMYENNRTDCWFKHK